MENIIISNASEFERKKKKMIEEGVGKLHVLSDFDRTLTKAFHKDEKTGSIISKLRKEKGKYLTEDYAERAQKLFDKYHPIEISQDFLQYEKNEKMFEWWKKHKELLIECGFDKNTVVRIVNDMIEGDYLVFRNKVREFLESLEKKKIPLIIMTSSLGDLVEEFMKQKKVLSDNVYIIGNSFEFNKDGKAIGIKKIIHVFNKNEQSVSELPVFKELLNRKNVILLGDSLGDLGMIEGFDYDNLIKIGFLNENVEGSLEEFKKSYDVVILNDGDFGFINELVGGVVGV